MNHFMIATLSFFLLPATTVAQSEMDGSVVSTTLYCTGSTWDALLGGTKTEVDGIVELSDSGLYIGISPVGEGSTDSYSWTSNTSISGSMIFLPGIQGQQPRDIQFTLNRYSGELTIYPELIDGGTLLFRGSCDKRKPLF